MKYKSKQSSIRNLKKFFSSVPDSDSITLEDAYKAFNRDLSKTQSNKNWITNLMTHLKWNNLVLPVYSSSDAGRRILIGLQLTMEGKKCLGRIQPVATINQNHLSYSKSFELPSLDDMFTHPNAVEKRPVESLDSVSDIMKAIAKLKENHPEFEIIFDMKLRGV